LRASAAIMRPPASKAKPSTRPPVLANTSCLLPSSLHPDQVAATHGRVELPVGSNGDVFRTDLAPGIDRPETSEPRVHGEGPGIARRSRRWPDTGVAGTGHRHR
jgi:hypothetical protein